MPPSTVPPVATVTEPPSQPPCLEGERAFTADGLVGVVGEATGDAAILTAITWTPFAECETLVIDFATADAAPAVALGATQLRLLPDPGILRISLPDGVDDTALADVLLEGSLVDRAFVVRRADASLFIDVHLGEPAAARAFALSSPGRLIVDLRPGDGDRPSSPVIGADIVVTTPIDPEASYPLEVAGYARRNAVALLEAADSVLDSADIEAGGYPWTEFSLEFRDGPLGVVRIQLATDTETLEVPLVMR